MRNIYLVTPILKNIYKQLFLLVAKLKDNFSSLSIQGIRLILFFYLFSGSNLYLFFYLDVNKSIRYADTCEDKPDGLYPMKDCTKYMNCTNEEKTVFYCEKGFIYKADKQHCVPKHEITNG